MSLAAGVYRATPDVLKDGRAGEMLIDPAHRGQMVESAEPMGVEAVTVRTVGEGWSPTDVARRRETMGALWGGAWAGIVVRRRSRCSAASRSSAPSTR